MTDRKQALIDLKDKVEAGTVDIADELVLVALPKPAFAYTLFYQSYHGSVDAALSLLEAVLPGWDAHVFKSGSAWIYKPTRNAPPDMESEACVEDQPARALLLAILSAL